MHLTATHYLIMNSHLGKALRWSKVRCFAENMRSKTASDVTKCLHSKKGNCCKEVQDGVDNT